jgi:hypothetical protein
LKKQRQEEISGGPYDYPGINNGYGLGLRRKKIKYRHADQAADKH